MKLRDKYFTVTGRGSGKTTQITIAECKNAMEKALLEGRWEEYYRIKKLFKEKKV